MDIFALVFLIAGKVANIKGLLTASIVISSAILVFNIILSAGIENDRDKSFKAMLGVVIDAIILTLSIIFRVGM